jgi:zeta-carotene desaturase
MTHTPDVVVIGAGFAGLSTAVSLAVRGRRTLVLEARNRLGGRATAFADRASGEVVDNGQHVLLGCYHETFAFLRRLGADHLVDLQDRLEVAYVDRNGAASTLRCPAWPSPWHLVGGVLRWPALSLRDRASVARLGPALMRARRWVSGEVIAAHDLAGTDETVEAWLARHGQGARIREMLWEPLALAALNQDIRTAAALPFVRVLGGVFGPGPRDSAICLSSVPLDEAYAEPARRLLERLGSEVRLNALARVVVDRKRVVGVEVRDAPDITASRVIVAVPWHDLPAVFRGDTHALDDVMASAAATAASPIVTVNLWCDRPVIGAPFVGLPGRVMQWVFDKGAILGRGFSHLSLVSSGAEDVLRRSNAALVDLAASELRGAFPAMRDAVVRRGLVVREPRATFSLAPGQPPRPPTRTAVEGLYLAGDWVDTGLPATIEGAVVSGHRAADAALADLDARRDEGQAGLR